MGIAEKRELQKILNDHELWLNNDERGKKLVWSELTDQEKKLFENAYLHSANLRLADLSFGNLERTNLSYADLTSANLEHTNLSKASLRRATLSSTHLKYANLSYTDLDYSTGFSLSCNGLNVRLDKEHIYQYLYHLHSNSIHLELDEELRNVLIKYGNKWKRIENNGLMKH